MTSWGISLPDFPWDLLIPYSTKAKAHPDGIIDLSVGTPVDPTPQIVQVALQSASDAPGYPTTLGLPEFRQAAVDWLSRNHNVSGLDIESVIPSIGSKEIVAWLPRHLGLGQGDVIALPATAYPTYEIGGLLAGVRTVLADNVAELDAAFAEAKSKGESLRMAWINSPSNPTGAVKTIDELKALVDWARNHEVLLVSDECYLDLGWDVDPFSLLNREVTCGDVTGLLIVHSLSKRSNLAGYRAGFVAGDKQVLKAVLEVRKHSGLILSTPVQKAAIAAMSDDVHVQEQKARYASRRDVVLNAVRRAGFQVEHSNAGLYVWAYRDADEWQSLDWFAERGVLVAPGSFYGAAGKGFVRVALTASDERIAALNQRF